MFFLGALNSLEAKVAMGKLLKMNGVNQIFKKWVII